MEKKAKTTGIGDDEDVVGDSPESGGKEKTQDIERETRGDRIKEK